ncbi:hypothetical protein PsYK624_096420 [Phanerochaete sordida]|uniref:SAP domain-containing protein n=1 Tax=Phanerochaete sordida TaxID=48140 RepID=A0A9P3GCA6_9APHY|nr:hypothetical protein PsYK624_096420 [Phanerochaete sordida]
MSTTTQILFHSPSLKSLKREQLMKLCKRHGVRANGKNTELIERLRQKATELPAEEIVWRDSDEEEDMDPFAEDSLMAEEPPRPSEQWEVVMDDIEEVDESQPASRSGTLTSTRNVRTPVTPGEFGTAGSKGSVTSNLKAAIANSFGLKRAGLAKNDPLDIGTTKSLPILPSQSDIPAVDEPSVEPIPGAPSRPGMAAPTNARLSTGSSGGVTTTIRLISKAKSVIDTPPRLAPFSTTLDLDMGTPSATRNVWPPTPSATLDSSRLYPAIPPEDLRPAFTSSLKKTPAKMTPFKSTPVKGTPARGTPGNTPLKHEMPSDTTLDIFSPAKTLSKPTPKLTAPSSTVKVPLDVPAKPQARVSVSQDDPFLFGSPLPRHSMTNTQFDTAAQDVLAEMNRRLAATGVPAVAKTVLDTKGAAPLPPPKAQKGKQPDRFAGAHDKAFGKMDSIANHYAARRPAPKPADAPPALGKRKSDAVGPARVAPAARRPTANRTAQTRVFSTGNRTKMAVPGGFGEENDGDEEEPEAAGDHRSSKRMRVHEGEDVHKGKRMSLLPNDGKTPEERAAEDRKREREREALKKKIDARRKSRSSISGMAAVAAKPKPARTGFFGAAKTLVGKVWNMGAGTSKPAATKPSRPATTAKAPVAQKATASSLAKTVQSTAVHSKAPPKTDTVGSTGLARPPIPSFERPTGQAPTAASTVPLQMRKTSNPKPPVGPEASSLGARKAPIAGPSNATSLGARRPTGTNVPTIRTLSETADPKPSLAARKRTISTLLAPTASSLAKRAAATSSGAGPSRATPLASPGEATLQQITNNSKTPRPLPTAPRTPVFGSPDAPSSPTAHLAADENQGMSLGAGAHELLGSGGDQEGEGDGDGEDGAPLVPPKPRSLIARKPRISRTKVMARVGQQRSVSAASSTTATPRTRSSVGATPRRSAGVTKNPRGPSGAGVDIMMKKRVRKSEIAQRQSNIGGVRPKKWESGVAMEVDG